MLGRIATIAKLPKSDQTCISVCKQKPGLHSSLSSADRILQLQRTAGNQAVQNLIKSRALQAKLRIGKPNDVYEQETDRVAEQVLRIPDSVIQRKCSKCNEDEKRVLQAKVCSGQTQFTQGKDIPPIIHEVISSSGQILDPTVRAFMEPRFGHNFSQIRIHANDSKSESTANFLGARAYTAGNHIVFGRGGYTPSTTDGKALLAHELAHTIQQNKGISPHIQKRQLTPQEQNSLRHMDELADEAKNESTPKSGPPFAQKLRELKADLIGKINAIPEGKSDPDNLMATLWTLHIWNTNPSNYAQSRAISSTMSVRNLSDKDYKCNRFVGDTYAIGAKKGYGVYGAGNTYPTGKSPLFSPYDPYPPSANELGSPAGATGNLTNLPLTNTPETGNIIAFPSSGGIGHSGIYLGHDLYISARHSYDHPGITTQVDDGVQITNIPNYRSAVYREFKP